MQTLLVASIRFIRPGLGQTLAIHSLALCVLLSLTYFPTSHVVSVIAGSRIVITVLPLLKIARETRSRKRHFVLLNRLQMNHLYSRMISCLIDRGLQEEGSGGLLRVRHRHCHGPLCPAGGPARRSR